MELCTFLSRSRQCHFVNSYVSTIQTDVTQLNQLRSTLSEIWLSDSTGNNWIRRREAVLQTKTGPGNPVMVGILSWSISIRHYLYTVLLVMHNCGSIRHKYEFWYTLEICESSWCTHIFKAIEIVDCHLAHHWYQISKVRNAKLCLSNHIPVHDADWFKCHFWQLYFKADRSEIHFLSMPLSLRLKTCRLYLAYMYKEVLGSKVWWKYYVEGERSIKAAQKDPSTTVVTSICLTSATLL